MSIHTSLQGGEPATGLGISLKTLTFRIGIGLASFSKDSDTIKMGAWCPSNCKCPIQMEILLAKTIT